MVNGDSSDWKRRAILKKTGLGVGLATALAGCTGQSEPDDPDGGDGSNQDGSGDGSGDGSDQDSSANWPPGGGRIDLSSGSGAGSGSYMYTQIYADHLPKYLPDGDQLQFFVHDMGGAGGVRLNNYAAVAESDGSELMFSVQAAPMNMTITNPDETRYEMGEFNYLAQAYSFTRCIAISHHNVDSISDYWDWEWDTFIENAHDLKYATISPTHGSTMAIRLLAHFHPDLDADIIDDNIIFYGGGSEARAGIERGEADVYLGSFSSQQTRPEHYKIQFVLTDDRYSAYNETLKAMEPDAKTLEDTDLDQESKETIVNLIQDLYAFFLPPGASDEIKESYLDAFRQCYEDDDVLSDIEDARGDLRVSHNPLLGDDLQQNVQSMWDTRQNNADLVSELLEEE